MVKIQLIHGNSPTRNVSSREPWATCEEFTWTDQGHFTKQEENGLLSPGPSFAPDTPGSPSVLNKCGIWSVHLYYQCEKLGEEFQFVSCLCTFRADYFYFCFAHLAKEISSHYLNNSYLKWHRRSIFFWTNPLWSSFLCMVQVAGFLLEDNDSAAKVP